MAIFNRSSLCGKLESRKKLNKLNCKYKAYLSVALLQNRCNAPPFREAFICRRNCAGTYSLLPAS